MVTLQHMGQDKAGQHASPLVAPKGPAGRDRRADADHDGEDGTRPQATGVEEASCVVAVVESRSLLRDCISHLLLTCRDVTVKRYITLGELLFSDSSHDLDLIILGAANKSRQEALDEISRLRETDHACRLIILAES